MNIIKKKLIAALLGVFTLGVTAEIAYAETPLSEAPIAIHPNLKSYPLTYGEWGARWWQYVMGIPADQNPLADLTGEKCGLGQWGPVFFLMGTMGGAAERTCNVPLGKALFFPIQNTMCSIPEDGTTLADISRPDCNVDAVIPKTLSVTVDGVDLKRLYKYRGKTFFSFTGGAPSVFGSWPVAPHYEGYHETAFADGYWVMLKPLSAGLHDLHFKAGNPPWLEVTYHLNVQ
jgi:hypothetical protein